ncbi:MAG: exodeoxyribonuclease VII large subunit [Bacillota bacterium]|nr:exodeoxyribonuclease VII large subunit [Bacillota bacterium]
MQRILSISEINRYIKDIVSKDIILSDVWVKGEISNFKNHYSGHMYFTLKDENSVLKCVMFKSHATGLKFVPDNGMKVIVRGYVSVFERDGQYQLYAEEMTPDGLGNLHLAFEQLKKKLAAEGLFDEKFKKKIPFLPRTIGVVTSPTGAVIRDICNVLNRRFSKVEVKVFGVAVQGEAAPKQIARAIKLINDNELADIIIVARGGGSLEELWAFNDELVARSIFASKIPVISAVGHETDFTIADFVSDLRAPTPSAAAELAVPDRVMLCKQLDAMKKRMEVSFVKNIERKRDKLHRMTESTAFKQPFNRVYQERMRLDQLNKYLIRGVEANRERSQSKLATLIGKLDAMSPLGIMTRGYSVVRRTQDGKIVKSISDVQKDQSVEINVNDGKINCIVNNMEAGKNK